MFSTQGYCDYAANVNCAGRTIPEYGEYVSHLWKILSYTTNQPTWEIKVKLIPNSWTCILVPKDPEVHPVKPVVITDQPTVLPGSPLFGSSDCPKPSGTFRNKTKCSGYFTCIDNKVVVSSECAGGLLFNDVRKLTYLKVISLS